MRTIYLAGHGEWNMSDGYATVPAGCSIAFYTEFSKNMFTSDMKAIIGGTFTGSVKQKIEQFKSVPNYTLSADAVSFDECHTLLAARADPNLTLIMFKAGPAWKLTEIFALMLENRVSADMIWCACRFTGLADSGGKRIGVNGAQGTWGDRDNLGRLIAPDAAVGNTSLYYFNPTAKVVKNL